MYIYQMTASYSRGDAIGNYMQTLDRIFNKFGFDTKIFSDITLKNPHSSKYKHTGNNILWFHYSIYSDNLKYLKLSNDIKVMDFHGVAPSHLFKGYNSELEYLCQKGNDLLKEFVSDIDLCIVHSEYSRSILEKNGYKNIIKLPLVVDTNRFEKIKDDQKLSILLKKIEYMLFVGRIVPQKSIIDIIKVFYHLKQLIPNFKLILVGDCNFSKEYINEIMSTIRQFGLFNDIILTGKLDDSGLVTFYKHARLFIILSEWETFCVPLIESMYYQVPIIGYDKTAIPDTIGDAGILFGKIDHVEISKRINELLNNNTEYELLRQKCKKRVQYFTEHSLELQLSSLKELLRVKSIYIPNYEKEWDNLAKTDVLNAILTGSNPDTFDDAGKRCAIMLSKYINIDSVVLDLGCGIGRIEKFLGPLCKELHAADISLEMLKKAEKRLEGYPNILLQKLCGTDLKCYPDNKFDFIFSIQVLQHIEKEDTYIYLEEIYRVLKNKGKIFIQFPNLLSDHYFKYFMESSHGDRGMARVRVYTVPEVRKIVESIGFNIEDMSNDDANITEIVVIASKR